MSVEGKKGDEECRSVREGRGEKVGWMDGENEEGNGLVGMVLSMTIG